MPYKFSWKKRFLKQSRIVVGHRYDQQQQKMVLYKEDGSVEEIPDWHKCGAILGKDWVLFTKKEMETKAGATIPLSI